jgi:hypothetical protein
VGRFLEKRLKEKRMLSKITPWPWKIGVYRGGRMAVDGANGEEVTGWIASEDSCLIAVAPEMLDLLKKIASTDNQWAVRARELIEKTTLHIDEQNEGTE